MSLSHLNEEGQAHMVDISQKQETERFALAKGFLTLSNQTIQRIIQNDVPKGDVLATARIAGIMAAKKTQELIPLCHQINLLSVEIDIQIIAPQSKLEITSKVKAKDRTGAEMEALTAVSVAALTLYDMLKSIDKEMVISNIQLEEKQGGKAPFKRNFHVRSKGEATSNPTNASAHSSSNQTSTVQVQSKKSQVPASMTFDQLLEGEDEKEVEITKNKQSLPPISFQKNWFNQKSTNSSASEASRPQTNAFTNDQTSQHQTDDRSQEDILVGDVEDTSEWGSVFQSTKPITPSNTPFFRDRTVLKEKESTQVHLNEKSSFEKVKIEVSSLSHLSKISQESLISKHYTPVMETLDVPPPPFISSTQVNYAQNLKHQEAEAKDFDSSMDMGNWEESMLLDQSEELGEELLLNPPSISDSARQLKDLVEAIDIENQKFKDFVSKRAIELAYILGYLTPDYYRNCRAWVLWDKDHQEIQSLLFEYNGLSLATLWSYGSALHIEAMINALSKELPRRVQFNMEDHHLQSIRTLYAVKHRKPTLRMGLDRDHYQAMGNIDQVEVLSHKDTGAIMRLYHQYPDHLFEPAQLDTGLYCGIKVEQELISVAGIHLLSENYNVAAIGNIVTDEKYRGKGLASKCVRHVLDDLFKKIERVALNVQEGNYPAISCYQKFGFRTVSRLIEAQGKLR